jgi:ArsR family transcriptional regulator
MDSGALLDLLGNENRRRILQLLARKPCYVTEISEYIGVSPKAVIDHLRKLEEAGLVESHTDDQRRKYFHISQNLRLEVNLSPYDFGAKSAYPASADLDLSRCSHLSISVRQEHSEGVHELAAKLDELRDLERELSMAQRWVQGRVADVQTGLADAVGNGEGRVAGEVLAALAGHERETRELAREVDVPQPLVETVLTTLAEEDIVEHSTDGWRILE